jgi:23S rRNA (adenine2503-C2)-methyltransferase
MACAFCATGRLGLGRDLTAAEIVAQFVTVRDEAPGRVSGAVLMGQGEPLHAYASSLAACAILRDPCGGRIAAEAISVSTVGLTDRIRQFTAEGHTYRLVVSLHSTVPERRAALLPVAGKLELDDLYEAMREHAEARRTRVTTAWTLIGGVNHGPDEVDGLRRLAERVPIRLDIIDVNDPRPDGFRRATDDERGAFLDAVMGLGIPVVRRYSVGRASQAACGMLANALA